MGGRQEPKASWRKCAAEGLPDLQFDCRMGKEKIWVLLLGSIRFRLVLAQKVAAFPVSVVLFVCLFLVLWVSVLSL